MVDNSSLPVASGNETFANNDIGGVKYPRQKSTWGPAGTANDTDVASGKAMPIQVRSATGLIPIGEPTDAKSTATDTTSASAISIWKQISASVQALNTAIGSTLWDLGSGTGGTRTQRVIFDSSQFSALGQTIASASTPVVIASDQSTIPAKMAVSATANGGTVSRVNAAASTNATNLKASAGQLYTIDVFNPAAYNVFLKLYNKASSPTVGTDTPVTTIPVQAGGGYSKVWPMGLPFATGISYAITKLQADSDTTVLVAGDLTGNMLWI